MVCGFFFLVLFMLVSLTTATNTLDSENLFDSLAIEYILPIIAYYVIVFSGNELDEHGRSVRMMSFVNLLKTCNSFHSILGISILGIKNEDSDKQVPYNILRLWHMLTVHIPSFGKFVLGTTNNPFAMDVVYNPRNFKTLWATHPFTYVFDIYNMKDPFFNFSFEALQTGAHFHINIDVSDESSLKDLFRFVRSTNAALAEITKRKSCVHIICKIRSRSNGPFIATLENLGKVGHVIVSLISNKKDTMVVIPGNLKGWENSHLFLRQCSLSIANGTTLTSNTLHLDRVYSKELRESIIKANNVTFWRVRMDSMPRRIECKRCSIALQNNAENRRFVKTGSALKRIKSSNDIKGLEVKIA